VQANSAAISVAAAANPTAMDATGMRDVFSTARLSAQPLRSPPITRL
jgi:hypothetical protein